MRNNGPMSKQERRVPVGVWCVVALLVVGVLVAGGWAGWRALDRRDAERATADTLEQVERLLAQQPDGSPRVEAELPLPTEGDPLWRLEIPRLDVRVPVVAGTDDDALHRGVGWYPTTDLPGEAGNVAIAGRAHDGARPFARIEELRAGDEVVVTTRLHRYTYAVRVAPADLTVAADASWVLDRVPGKDVDPHEAVITLTTDQDPVPTADRSVAFAVLTKEEQP